MTPEQKVQLRSMAVDLAVRSGKDSVDENLIDKAAAIYAFIMTDVTEAKAQQEAKVVSLV